MSLVSRRRRSASLGFATIYVSLHNQSSLTASHRPGGTTPTGDTPRTAYLVLLSLDQAGNGDVSLCVDGVSGKFPAGLDLVHHSIEGLAVEFVEQEGDSSGKRKDRGHDRHHDGNCCEDCAGLADVWNVSGTGEHKSKRGRAGRSTPFHCQGGESVIEAFAANTAFDLTVLNRIG